MILSSFISIMISSFSLLIKNTPNYKIGVTSLANPDFEKAKTVIPESKDFITSIHSSKNYLIYSLSDGVNQDKYQINLQTLATKNSAAIRC